MDKSNTGYDKTSVASIVEYSRRLSGKSLGNSRLGIKFPVKETNKGDLGSLVEKYYFEHTPPSSHGPDFPEAGLELKTTGVKSVKRSDTPFAAKERLVLTMIDYNKIVDEEWETSTVLAKCRLMLMLFYEYAKEVPVTERKFVLDPLLVVMGEPEFRTSTHDLEFITSHAMQLPEADLSIIRTDWEYIRNKVRQGKAHELSEGDTTYLGACRKGAGGASEALRDQPYSTEKAKSRAFAFKQGYVTALINGHVNDKGLLFGKKMMTLEEATSSRFEPFVGRTLHEIATKLGVHVSLPQPKNYKRMLVDLIIKSSGGSVAELQKADIELKTILLTPKGLPQEDMSFPAFSYSGIVNQDWEDSSFSERTERRFLFVVFQKDELGIVRLIGFKYWNMPPEDRKEAQRVFEETKRRVKAGNHKLPAASESRVAHVRPKAANSSDVGVFPDGSTDVKKCFWLNKTYVAEAISHLQNS